MNGYTYLESPPEITVEQYGNSPVTPTYGNSGITLREHFAGLALQGLLANPNVDQDELTAEEAVSYADDLIHALMESTND